MNRLFAAIRFLTVLPLPGARGHDPEALARSTPFFPLVGALIGAAAAGCAWGFGLLLPDLLTAVLTVVLLMAASGGLHMDGLSDTADGFFSARSRERMLEIMKDSHIGAMGVMAIVAVFSIKAAALAGLPLEVRWRGVFLMPLAGRCALVISMAVLPYARPEGGLGALFYGRRPRMAAVWAFFVLVLAGWALAEWRGVVAAVASAVLTLALALHAYRKIGGATGDTLGGTCEVVEIVPAVTLCVWAG